MERENIFLIVILRLIFSSQTNLWINLLFLHIEVSLHLTYIPFTVHQYIKSIILSISQKSRTHTHYKTIIKIFNISHSMEKTSSTFGSISKPKTQTRPKLVTPSKSWATLWVILSFLDGSRANENAVSAFSLFLTATRAWRFIKFHDCRLAFHRDEPRYTETMMAIAILEESRLYPCVFCPPRKSSSSQGLAESLALSRSNRPRIRSSCDLWLSSIAIIFDSRYRRYVLR